jgi:hypothetical protein
MLGRRGSADYKESVQAYSWILRLRKLQEDLCRRVQLSPKQILVTLSFISPPMA